ncbi:MAG: radical SAM protein, partial [bacterium]|nr:radical SAM protein [bacterium]
MTTVPALISGGVMLTYRCTNACKHCAYRCSPARPDYFMPEEMIDRTFAALAKEPRLHGIHLAGGEATLHWERLEYAIRSAERHGVNVDYLETNLAWCDDYQTARDGFEQLRRAGLRAVLTSASLFHNEFTPLEKTKAGIRAAQEVFGWQGVIVWTPEVLQRMEGLDASKTHPLKRSCELLGLDPKRGDVWQVHNYLTPGGRTTEKLTEGVERRAAEQFAGQSCRATLESTSHFHIDPYGNRFTCHCPGISVA